jgi:hypothetical protein
MDWIYLITGDYMAFGIEEEFLVVDPSNFFYTPGAPKLLLRLLYNDKRYLSKSSMESILGREGRFSLKNRNDLVKGFSVVETKTSPQKCIDSLKDEVIFHRNNLAEAAKDSNLAILPVGIHPLFSKEICGTENVAALHIHIESKKQYYQNILRNIPQMISLTANSPFSNGEHSAMSSRALFSPSIGIPNNFYKRKSDLIINRHFNTIELRACDTQILPDDVIGAAATIQCIARSPLRKGIKRCDYVAQRQEAIYRGKAKMDLETLLNEISGVAEELSLSDYVSKFFNRKTGGELQYECFKNYGFPTLLSSLWRSFEKGRFVVDSSNVSDDTTIKPNNYLIYLFIYSPIHFFDTLKKIRRDDLVNTTDFFGKNPSEKVESLYEEETAP